MYFFHTCFVSLTPSLALEEYVPGPSRASWYFGAVVGLHLQFEMLHFSGRVFIFLCNVAILHIFLRLYVRVAAFVSHIFWATLRTSGLFGLNE